MEEYLTLTRRLRPRRWGELYGQPHVSQGLINAIASGKVAHAYLLVGTRGTGKTTTARILSAAINCPNRQPGTADPCGECPTCKGIYNGTNMLVSEIDGGTNNKVENARDLVMKAHYGSGNQCRIWIIDECHQLTAQAWAALLKTIEEPNKNVKWILCTTDSTKVPLTIKSRCQTYDFHPQSIPAVETYITWVLDSLLEGNDPLVAKLVELSSGGAAYQEEAIRSIATYADGSIRDALSILEGVINNGTAINIEAINTTLGKASPLMISNLIDVVLAGKHQDADKIMRDLWNDHFQSDLLEYLFNLYWKRAIFLKHQEPGRHNVTVLLDAVSAYHGVFHYAINRDLLLYTMFCALEKAKHKPAAAATLQAPPHPPKADMVGHVGGAIPQDPVSQQVAQTIARFECNIISPWDGKLAVIGVGPKQVLLAISYSIAAVPQNVGYVIPLKFMDKVINRPSIKVSDMVTEGIIVKIKRSSNATS